MTKRKGLLYVALGMIMLGVAIFAALMLNRKPNRVISATVNRDCAPWDGSAFTVQIPWEGGDMINISIWQVPEINFLKSFAFPDDTGQIGTVRLIHPSGLSEALAGVVWLKNVSVGMPIAGRFNLRSASGA